MNARKARVIAGCGVLALLIAYILFGKQPDKILTDRRKAKEARDQRQQEKEELAWGKTHIETEILSKEADDEDLAKQIADMLVPGTHIPGQWNGDAHDNGVFLTITGGADGELNVLFFADGDMSRWRLERKGRFKSGVLVLDSPVMGYPGDVYRRFYAIETPNGTRLATQSFVRNWLIARDGRKWKRDKWLVMDMLGGLLKKETE